MKIQGFLDHLLKSSSGSGSVLNADFGKGAISGGALGLLLGKNKTTRKLAKDNPVAMANLVRGWMNN